MRASPLRSHGAAPAASNAATTAVASARTANRSAVSPEAVRGAFALKPECSVATAPAPSSARVADSIRDSSDGATPISSERATQNRLQHKQLRESRLWCPGSNREPCKSTGQWLRVVSRGGAVLARGILEGQGERGGGTTKTSRERKAGKPPYSCR